MGKRSTAYSPSVGGQRLCNVAVAIADRDSKGESSQKPYNDGGQHRLWYDAFGVKTLLCKMERGINAGQHELGR